MAEYSARVRDYHLQLHTRLGYYPITAYKPTHFGVELDRMNTDVSKTPRAYYEKVKLLLSERFIGFFMIPSQVGKINPHSSQF